ncbi:uncharacterized protein LOC143177941 [Calliopsis andreniformis]|uniref:uncharacterized protein LOC143177941 n=1 Tax=Calliopsis andreniformis TaxID=337506 RepID=UPI003FCDC4D9
MKGLDTSGLCNTYEAVTPRKTSASPKTPPEMPDLETIIREFEMGYLSPRKQDTDVDSFQQKNFVKKIVAAFEVKYKVYDDLKTAYEEEENQEKKNAESTQQPKKRSGIFSSPFRSSSKGSKHSGLSDDSSDDLNQNREDAGKKRRSGIFSTTSKYSSSDLNSSRGSGIFVSPFQTDSSEDRNHDDSSKEADRSSGIFFTSKNSFEGSKSSRKSGIFSSPFNRNGSKDVDKSDSDIYMSPVNLDRQNSKDSSSSGSEIFKFDEEESKKKVNFQFSPLKMSSLDDTSPLESIDFDVTLPQPEETILLSGNGLPKTSTMINEFPKDEAARPSTLDRTPKIVGAFLKKPIEVEDTSIDWIPITGKKLPRKRSLKKLLSSLTGKKLLKKSKLFSSERNLNEEPRELQDSGYDERSCSSSSLVSLVSFTEALLHQGNSYTEPEKRISLRTFRSRQSVDEEDEAFQDAYRAVRKCNKKRLLLTEVPRAEVKLDLGPCYPTSQVLTMSLDRRMVSRKIAPSLMHTSLPRLPKHPNGCKIPKHPFVSLTKMDEFQDSDEAESVVIKNDLYEVEFRKSSSDVGSSASSRDSSSAQSHYDIPRRFLSKSETEISQIYRPTGTRRQEEPIYDVPRTRAIDRPRSSVYEDALSLKRRSVNLVQSFPSFSPLSCAMESHYDIVKPRNCRVYFNKGAAHSDSDLVCMERTVF